jgi:hypothetical protein
LESDFKPSPAVSLLATARSAVGFGLSPSTQVRSKRLEVGFPGGALHSCPADLDLDLDGDVDVNDFFLLLAAWGPCPPDPDPCPGDLDLDGDVDVTDFFLLLARWT